MINTLGIGLIPLMSVFQFFSLSCQLFTFVSRLLPPRLTATLAASPTMSLMPLAPFSFSAFLSARSFVRRDLAKHAARLTDNANELRENTDCAGWLLVSAFQFSDF
jgi:hypothetical protein